MHFIFAMLLKDSLLAVLEVRYRTLFHFWTNQVHSRLRRVERGRRRLAEFALPDTERSCVVVHDRDV